MQWEGFKWVKTQLSYSDVVILNWRHAGAETCCHWMRVINRPSNQSLSDAHPLTHTHLFLSLRVNKIGSAPRMASPRGGVSQLVSSE
jgi:hypothetical protein